MHNSFSWTKGGNNEGRAREASDSRAWDVPRSLARINHASPTPHKTGRIMGRSGLVGPVTCLSSRNRCRVNNTRIGSQRWLGKSPSDPLLNYMAVKLRV